MWNIKKTLLFSSWILFVSYLRLVEAGAGWRQGSSAAPRAETEGFSLFLTCDWLRPGPAGGRRLPLRQKLRLKDSLCFLPAIGWGRGRLAAGVFRCAKSWDWRILFVSYLQLVEAGADWRQASSAAPRAGTEGFSLFLTCNWLRPGPAGGRGLPLRQELGLKTVTESRPLPPCPTP